MTFLLRLSLMLFALATLTVVGVDHAQAQPVTTNAKVKVKLNKPLVLTLDQNLDFGSVILSGGASADTFVIDQAGTVTCAAGATCTGAPQQALFTVSGTKDQLVAITVPDFDMVNASGDAIRFIPDAPATVTLPNSGNKGIQFGVGGAIDVDQDAGGNYVGTMTVTAEYQ